MANASELPNKPKPASSVQLLPSIISNYKRIQSLDLSDSDKRIEFEWNVEGSSEEEQDQQFDDAQSFGAFRQI